MYWSVISHVIMRNYRYIYTLCGADRWQKIS